MANLKLKDVAKSYGEVDVLKHIDLDIETGAGARVIEQCGRLIVGDPGLVRSPKHRLKRDAGVATLVGYCCQFVVPTGPRYWLCGHD